MHILNCLCDLRTGAEPVERGRPADTPHVSHHLMQDGIVRIALGTPALLFIDHRDLKRIFDPAPGGRAPTRGSLGR